MRVRCNSCKGEYDQILPDGMRYFHQCPPFVYVVVDRGDGPIAIPRAELKPDEEVHDTILRPRRDARNENLISVRDDAGKVRPAIVAVGLGVEPAPARPMTFVGGPDAS